MSRWKNWSAAVLCGTAVLAVAIVPHAKEETKDVAALEGESLGVSENPGIKASTAKAQEPLEEVRKLRQNTVVDQWLNAMKTDAFGDTLIFSQLSTFEPVMNIVKKGIVSFDRKTLRTPNYRDEQGYDLLVYEIHHPLSLESKVMAYHEKKADGSTALKIVFLTGRPGTVSGELVQFENGELLSHQDVAWSEAQQLFDRQLNEASVLMNASIH